MTKQSDLQLKREVLGAIPVIDPVIDKICLEKLLTDAMGSERYAKGILVLLKNVLVERNALYAIEEWSSQYDKKLVYGGGHGDDVIARSLDRLYASDRASLITKIVLSAVKAYGVNVDEIHQDTTSVKVSGAYENQKPKAVRLARGHSKDHRPDLKQLVYELSITNDGAIPVLFKAHDGNRTDDTLHWENWQALRGLLARSDFLYVADSKLCVHETLMNIDRNQGRFLTLVPRTRAEVEEFSHKVEASLVRWEKVFAKRSSRKSGRIDLYEVAEGIHQLKEGFRVYWFRSSEKARRDWQDREDRIDHAIAQIRALADPLRKRKPKTEKALKRKAQQILAHFHAEEWVKVEIALERVERFRQLNRGRATPDTVYRKTIRWVPRITCSRAEMAIAKSETMDGIFPLTTNTDLKAAAVLKAYKYQPKLEKRHALLKSGLEVAPIFLKKNERIESLMFVYFLAQLVCALIERQLRQAMLSHGLRQIQVLPEERPSSTPTAAQVIRVFKPRARHILLRDNGKIIQVFNDPLSPIQAQILYLLGIPSDAYA